MSEKGFYVNRISTLACFIYFSIIKIGGSEPPQMCSCSFCSCALQRNGRLRTWICVTAIAETQLRRQRRLRRQPVLVVTGDTIHSNGNSNWRWTERENEETRKRIFTKKEAKWNENVKANKSHKIASKDVWNDFDETIFGN